MKNTVILIGMPGVGKSTVGVVLAKRIGYRFVDSDLVIQEGYERRLEEARCVIATGGSAVYGREAMEHLRERGIMVYLKLSCEELRMRLGDLNERGVTLRPGQTLEGLYEERCPLYEKYAHLTIECEGRMLREIVAEITEALA